MTVLRIALVSLHVLVAVAAIGRDKRSCSTRPVRC